MKKKFYFYLFTLMIFSTAAYALVSSFYVEHKISKILNKNKENVISQIRNKYKTFKTFLSFIEIPMAEQGKNAVLKISRKLDWKNLEKYGRRELEKLAENNHVSEIYLINPRGIITATSFLPDLNLNLGELSEEFSLFLEKVRKDPRVFTQGITISNKTGSHNLYQYYSPPGEDRILEISLNVNEFIKASPKYQRHYQFLYGDFFQSLIRQNEYLEAFDMYIVSKEGQWSIVHEGKPFTKKPSFIRKLREQGEIRIKQEKSTVIYQIMRITGIAGTDSVYLELDFDFSALYGINQNLILYMFLAGVAVSVLFLTIFSKVFDKQFIAKVLKINRTISEIEKGNYQKDAEIQGNDEFSQISSHLRQLSSSLEKSFEKIKKYTRENRELNLYLNRIMDTIPDAVLVHDAKGRFIDVNITFIEMFGYTRQHEICQLNVEQISGPGYTQAMAMEKIGEALEKGRTEFEWLCKDKDGKVFPVMVRLRSLDYQGKRFVLSIITDITKQKQAEKKIRSALHEKDVLLKEVHHRVKNNFQIISGLLYLQSLNIQNPHALQVLKESQNRIESMALIHKKLYQSGTMADVDFAGYIFGLVDYLKKSYALESMYVQIKQKISPVMINMDTAIPCGLIINELVTNAIKYAFPEKKHGIIEIIFQKGEENRKYILIVRDNGVGVAPDRFYRKETLGWGMVSNLVDQLNGNLEINAQNGTEFRILIPAQEEGEVFDSDTV
jgi:PAS domain S-box-containing protein